jgi:hypothetical protein
MRVLGINFGKRLTAAVLADSASRVSRGIAEELLAVPDFQGLPPQKAKALEKAMEKMLLSNEYREQALNVLGQVFSRSDARQIVAIVSRALGRGSPTRLQ